MSCPFGSFLGAAAAPHPVPPFKAQLNSAAAAASTSAAPAVSASASASDISPTSFSFSSSSTSTSTSTSPHDPSVIPNPVSPIIGGGGCPMMSTGETPLLTSMPTTTFLNIFPDAVMLIDPARRITVCNDASARLWGYPISVLIGSVIEKLVPPKVQAYHHILVEKVFDDMLPREMANRKPVHGRHSSGRLFPATVQLIPCLLQLSETEIPRKFVWCIARDMSGYNKAMHDRQQAEQHSALVGKFLRLLNHEVRTSIHAISNAMNTLSHELDDMGQKPTSWSLLEVGVQQMNSLLTNMIDLRNLQENNMIQHNCFFQPSSVLTLLKDHTAQLWMRKKQQLLLHCDPAIPAVYGDPHLIAKCLTPLIENAIKYSADGACVLVSCTIHQDSVNKITTSTTHTAGWTSPSVQLSPRRSRGHHSSHVSEDSGGTGTSEHSQSSGAGTGAASTTSSSGSGTHRTTTQSTAVSLTSFARPKPKPATSRSNESSTSNTPYDRSRRPSFSSPSPPANITTPSPTTTQPVSSPPALSATPPLTPHTSGASTSPSTSTSTTPTLTSSVPPSASPSPVGHVQSSASTTTATTSTIPPTRPTSHGGKRKAVSKAESPNPTPSGSKATSPKQSRRTSTRKQRVIQPTSTPLQMELVRSRARGGGGGGGGDDEEDEYMGETSPSAAAPLGPVPAPSVAPALHQTPAPSQSGAASTFNINNNNNNNPLNETPLNVDEEEEGIDCQIVFRVSDCGSGLSRDSLYSMAAGFFQVDASSTRNTAGGVGIGINLSKLAAEALHADLQVWSTPHQQPIAVAVNNGSQDENNNNNNNITPRDGTNTSELNGNNNNSNRTTSPNSAITQLSTSTPHSQSHSAASSSSTSCSSFYYRDHVGCDADVVCDSCACSFQSMCSTCFTLTVPYIAFPNMVLDESMEPNVSVAEPLQQKIPSHPTVLNPHVQADIIQQHPQHEIHIESQAHPYGITPPYHPSSHVTTHTEKSISASSTPSTSPPQASQIPQESPSLHSNHSHSHSHRPVLKHEPLTPQERAQVKAQAEAEKQQQSYPTSHDQKQSHPSISETQKPSHPVHFTDTAVGMEIDSNGHSSHPTHTGSPPSTSTSTSTSSMKSGSSIDSSPSILSSPHPRLPISIPPVILPPRNGSDSVTTARRGNAPTIFNPKLKSMVLKKMASPETAKQRAEFKILIVEDNLINVKVIRQCLVKRGFQTITVAENGQIALDVIETRWRQQEMEAQRASSTDNMVLGMPTSIDQFVTPFPFQVILMDCEMPVMDGYTCTARLRARHVTCPILALTANATLDAQRLCATAGMDLYLTKPLCAEDLLFALASLAPFSMYPSERCPYALMAHFSSTRQQAMMNDT